MKPVEPEPIEPAPQQDTPLPADASPAERWLEEQAAKMQEYARHPELLFKRVRRSF